MKNTATQTYSAPCCTAVVLKEQSIICQSVTVDSSKVKNPWQGGNEREW